MKPEEAFPEPGVYPHASEPACLVFVDGEGVGTGFRMVKAELLMLAQWCLREARGDSNGLRYTRQPRCIIRANFPEHGQPSNFTQSWSCHPRRTPGWTALQPEIAQ